MKTVFAGLFALTVASTSFAEDPGPVCDILTFQKKVVATASLNYKRIWSNGNIAGFVSPRPFYVGDVFKISEGQNLQVGSVKGTHIGENISLYDSNGGVIGHIASDGSPWDTGPGTGLVFDPNGEQVGYVYCYSYNEKPRPSRATYRWMGLWLADMNIAGAGVILSRAQLDL